MASGYRSEAKHAGDEGLVICMDIGTTQSAVSFVYLYKDEYPTVRMVTRWPGQETASGDAKIPTMIAYQNGVAQAFGVEAVEYSEDDEYQMAYWFKLHLHPDTMKESDLPPAYGTTSDNPRSFEVPPLPDGVNLKKVYSDFIKYLYMHTRNFFGDLMPNGANIWTRLQSKILIIFCHPNGWDISQQAFLSQAAVEAGIVVQEDTDSRIEFVTEGEASVHYAVAHTPSASWLESNRMFVVVDAGGSTIDSNLYECKSTDPLRLEEVHRSECIQAGGVFVDRALRVLLKQKLSTSAVYGTDEMVDAMVKEFEKKTKRLFGSDLTSNVIHFGRAQDNDRANGILKGRITLTSEEIGSVFNDPVSRTIDSCLKLLKGHKVQYLLLVGGFGESPFLRQRLKAEFSSEGTQIVTVEQSSKKAAVEGGIIWYMKNLVSARAARFPVGIPVWRPYNDSLPEHLERATSKVVWPDGSTKIRNFVVSIQRDTVLHQGWEYRTALNRTWKSFPGTIGDWQKNIYVWEGDGTTEWLRDKQGRRLPELRDLCTVKASLGEMVSALETRHGPDGKYWLLEFEVVIKFGATSLRAWLEWGKEGIKQRSPASILPGRIF
ncbi:hypothetical protein CPB86DRAFT_789732 [Serendipita vermifera]|nr:hypothetical protein CPB86DRAFT_789732 [Serendipita vermifera]